MKFGYYIILGIASTMLTVAIEATQSEKSAALLNATPFAMTNIILTFKHTGKKSESTLITLPADVRLEPFGGTYTFAMPSNTNHISRLEAFLDGQKVTKEFDPGITDIRTNYMIVLGRDTNIRTVFAYPAALLNATSFSATDVVITMNDITLKSNTPLASGGQYSYYVPFGDNRYPSIHIEAMVNNRSVAKTLARESEALFPLFGTSTYSQKTPDLIITGPPDGSNPQIIQLIQ